MKMVFDIHMQIYISIQVGRPLDIKPCVSVTPHINNYDYVGRPLEMPLPSQGHYGFHSFPVVD